VCSFIIQLNKDKTPFLAVLDPKLNCWTDDEDDTEIDENTNLADLGGYLDRKMRCFKLGFRRKDDIFAYFVLD
jgi:hypothetical protein